MSNVFKIGDKVTYGQRKIKGTIRAMDVDLPHSAVKGAEVEFDDKKLIPPVMKVPYYTLKADSALPAGKSNSFWGSDAADIFGGWGAVDWGDDDYVDTSKKCPKCKTEWKETWFNAKQYFDCVKCNKTKEEIMEDSDG